MRRDVAGVLAFAAYGQVRDAFARLAVTDVELADLIATHAVEEQHGQQGTIALAQPRILRRRGQELVGLSVAGRRRLALVGVFLRPLDALERIVQDGAALAEILVQARDGGELAAARRGAHGAILKVAAPNDHVGPGDVPELGVGPQPDEPDELLNVVAVSPAGV